jgi:hypothetical protein
MAEPWLDVVEKGTEFFATAQIEACARRTGFVRRTSTAVLIRVRPHNHSVGTNSECRQG